MSEIHKFTTGLTKTSMKKLSSFALALALSLTGCVIPPAGVDSVHRSASSAEQKERGNPLSVLVPPEMLTPEMLTAAESERLFEPQVVGEKTRLSIVEFDDQGELKQPEQLIQTTRWLRTRGSGPILVMLFVHGWNHNAGAHDQNLADFRKTLEELRTTGVYPHGEILGVYLSWPGNVLNEPMFGDLALQFWSFGNRYRAAQRVGRLSCTEAMLSILASARLQGEGAEMRARERKDVQTVVVGHSMGGLVVERGFLQAMLGYNIINAPTDDLVKQLRDSTETEKNKHLEKFGALKIKYEGDPERGCEGIKTRMEKYSEAIKREEPNQANIKKWEDAITSGQKAESAMLASRESLLVPLNDLQKNISTVAEEFDQFRKDQFPGDEKQPAKIAANEIVEHLRNLKTGLLPKAANLIANLEALKDDAGLDEKWAKKFNQEFEALGTGEEGENANTFWKKAPVDSVETLVADPEFKKLDQVPKGRIYVAREALKATLKQVPVWVNSAKEFRQNLTAWEEANAIIAKLDTAKLEESKRKLAEAQANLVLETKNKKDNEEAEKVEILAASDAGKLVSRLDPMRQEAVADLVLLVNPASEAIIAQQVNELWNSGRAKEIIPNRNTKVPWIISVSSDMDTTTGWIYRAGMGMFGASSGSARKGQLLYMRNTAPHISDMQTHRVVSVGKDRYDLVPLGKGHNPRSPLWIVRVAKADLGKSVLTSHGDFWNPQFRQVVLLMMEKVKKIKADEEAQAAKPAKPVTPLTQLPLTNSE